MAVGLNNVVVDASVDVEPYSPRCNVLTGSKDGSVFVAGVRFSKYSMPRFPKFNSMMK